MPRFLCLHGHGTSAAIFKSQTAAFRSKLKDDYIFEFVDAPFPSCPAPGISAIYDVGKTYTWWENGDSQSIRASHQWVCTYARENGPFDAVCCFSQGCSLVASMALYHAVQSCPATGDAREGAGHFGVESTELPFAGAIMICGGIPLVALEDMGLAVSQLAHDISQRTGTLLNDAASRLVHLKANLNLIKPGVSLWDIGDDQLLHDPNVRLEPGNVFGLDFTALPPSARIKIPTLHIYGAKDPRWPAAKQLAHFCDDRVEYDHQGGHDIPRSTAVSSEIAALIEQLMGRIGCK